MLKYRYKVMVIPYTETGKFLLVKDKKTSEWGFISGGVKKNETMLKAANRELAEETSCIVSNISRCHTLIRFETKYRPLELLSKDKKNKEDIISIYHIYLFKISNIDILKFKPNKEVSELKVCNYNDNTCTWDFCDMVYNKYVKNIFYI